MTCIFFFSGDTDDYNDTPPFFLARQFGGGRTNLCFVTVSGLIWSGWQPCFGFGSSFHSVYGAYGAYSGCLVLWGIFLREQFGNLLFFYTCFGGGIGSFSLDGIMMGWSLQRENVIHKRLMGWLGRGQDCQMDRIEISVCSFTHCAHKTFLTS